MTSSELKRLYKKWSLELSTGKRKGQRFALTWIARERSEKSVEIAQDKGEVGILALDSLRLNTRTRGGRRGFAAATKCRTIRKERRLKLRQQGNLLSKRGRTMQEEKELDSYLSRRATNSIAWAYPAPGEGSSSIEDQRAKAKAYAAQSGGKYIPQARAPGLRDADGGFVRRKYHLLRHKVGTVIEGCGVAFRKDEFGNLVVMKGGEVLSEAATDPAEEEESEMGALF